VATPTPAPQAAPKAKLSYKDARRLAELETLTPRLTDQIRTLEQRLHDPQLYARDKAGFDRLMQQLAKARADLAASEEEWLRLEEKRESLAG
jgi:ATP-binding cassette subfamily F protein uup